MARLATPNPAAAPEAMLPLQYRVAGKRVETHDTWTLAIEPSHEQAAPFEPGQFAMLYAFGAGEVPISISDLGRPGALVHTVRAVGAATQAICSLSEGDPIGVRGPFGTAWPLADATGRDVIVVAGGIGLAPLRPAIHELLAHSERYGRVSILYGGRAPQELVFADELDRWNAAPGASVSVTVDRAPGGWRGRVGVVTTLIPRAQFDPANAVALICGPEVMMRFTVAALEERGVRADSIWVSYERSMKCAVGHCGHCQLGPLFICKDGAVLRHDVVAPYARVREL